MTTDATTPPTTSPPAPSTTQPAPKNGKAPLPRELASFLGEPPSVLIYGTPGTGKSTDIFKAFPEALYLITAKGVLRPAASWVRDNPKSGLTMPLPLMDPDSGKANKITFDRKARGGQGITFFDGFETDEVTRETRPLKYELDGIRRGAYIVLPEFAGNDDKGNQVRISNWNLLTVYANAFINRLKQEPNRYDALVIDEMSAFSTRVYEDIKADKRFCSANGNLNTFKANNELHTFHRWIGKFIPQQARKAVIMACHSAEPKYHDDENDPRHGRLKYMGGPRFPLGTLIESVTADMDVVLHLKMENDIDGSGRKYQTEADPLWVRKFRDFGIKPKEDIGLRELLVRAGYVA